MRQKTPTAINIAEKDAKAMPDDVARSGRQIAVMTISAREDKNNASTSQPYKWDFFTKPP